MKRHQPSKTSNNLHLWWFKLLINQIMIFLCLKPNSNNSSYRIHNQLKSRSQETCHHSNKLKLYQILQVKDQTFSSATTLRPLQMSWLAISIKLWRKSLRTSNRRLQLLLAIEQPDEITVYNRMLTKLIGLSWRLWSQTEFLITHMSKKSRRDLSLSSSLLDSTLTFLSSHIFRSYGNVLLLMHSMKKNVTFSSPGVPRFSNAHRNTWEVVIMQHKIKKVMLVGLLFRLMLMCLMMMY